MARKGTGTLMLTAIAAAAFAGPGEAQTVPDLSGTWARMTFGFEPPSSGPGPLTNLTRTREGRSDGNQLVGDHNNPILKPAAAAEVRRQGEISKTGTAFPDPANQCAPQGPPWVLRQQEIRLMQEKDQITSSTCLMVTCGASGSIRRTPRR